MRRIAAILAIASLLLPATRVFAMDGGAVDPERLLADADLADTTTMSKTDLQDLFSRGFLGTYKTKDWNGVTRTATDIVWRAAQAFDLNPRFLAVLLQREQSLVESQQPSKDQLDWAMGYSICDDCSKNDPRLKKFKGFGPQVYYAAQRISASYLPDLRAKGRTETGVGVGIPITVDGMPLVPRTKATAILYTYTPHLNGNLNFARIWERWFVPEYPSGSLLQDASTGGVWLVRNGTRYPLASKTVLATSFANRPIVRVSPTTLGAYPVGAALKYPNYSLLRTPEGDVYLIVDDMVRLFDSADIVRRIGFDPSEIVDVMPGELEGYVDGPLIDANTAAPQVRLLQDPKTGGIYAVQDGVKHPVVSPEILKAKYGSRKAIVATKTELAALPDGAPVGFPDGVLVAVKGAKDVYAISDGKRRLIMDQKTLAAYGWTTKQVIRTNQASVNVHPLGDALLSPTDASVVTASL